MRRRGTHRKGHTVQMRPHAVSLPEESAGGHNEAASRRGVLCTASQVRVAGRKIRPFPKMLRTTSEPSGFSSLEPSMSNNETDAIVLWFLCRLMRKLTKLKKKTPFPWHYARPAARDRLSAAAPAEGQLAELTEAGDNTRRQLQLPFLALTVVAAPLFSSPSWFCSSSHFLQAKATYTHMG